MEKVKNGLGWVIRSFFIICIPVFLVIYVRWFQLTPLGGSYQSLGAAGVTGGLIFLFLFSGSVVFLVRHRKRAFLFSAVLFFVLNIYIITNFPVLLDSAKLNGVTYYLTYTDSGDPSFITTELTIWKGWFKHEMLQSSKYAGVFNYDYDLGLVGVVADFEDYEILLYSLRDGELLRSYHQRTEYDNHLFYISRECINPTGDKWNPCEKWKNTIYQCSMENISCVSLPFQYTSPERIVHLELNEISGEINFLINGDTSGPIDEFILVYSYGPNPRCYVEGCEILGP